MAGLQKNKDLDLRRYGKNLYTKALQSGGDGSSEGGGEVVDYEGIYQFYRQQLLSMLPPEVETFIIPEHFEDIVDLEGEEYESNTQGIWLTDYPNPAEFEVYILFTVLSYESTTYIVFGEYHNTNDQSPVG